MLTYRRSASPDNLTRIVIAGRNSEIGVKDDDAVRIVLHYLIPKLVHIPDLYDLLLKPLIRLTEFLSAEFNLSLEDRVHAQIDQEDGAHDARKRGTGKSRRSHKLPELRLFRLNPLFVYFLVLAADSGLADAAVQLVQKGAVFRPNSHRVLYWYKVVVDNRVVLLQSGFFYLIDKAVLDADNHVDFPVKQKFDSLPLIRHNPGVQIAEVSQREVPTLSSKAV